VPCFYKPPFGTHATRQSDARIHRLGNPVRGRDHDISRLQVDCCLFVGDLRKEPNDTAAWGQFLD
jgi:hypothetical protein